MTNAPKIRFEGFTDDWEQLRLCDGVRQIGDGIHGTPIYDDDGETAFINGNNLVDGQVVTTNQTKYVRDEQKTIHDENLNAETILMSINGTIGNLAWYNGENIMLGKSVAYIKTSDFDKTFIYALLQTNEVKRFFLDNLTGTTIKNLGLKTIRETPVMSPSRQEQTQIGKFFCTLDNIITLHKRKLDGLKQLKKTYLQQMFPQAGENIARVRFTGFNEQWEHRTIDSIAGTTFGGGTPSTTNSGYWNGDIPWLQSSDLTKHDITAINLRKHITGEGLNNSATKLIPSNSIAIVTRVGVGKLSVIPFDFATSQDFLSLSNLDVDIWFGAYVLYNKLQSELHSVQGTSIKGLTKDELLNKIVIIPKLKEEQTLIGNFFRTLDEQITSQIKRIEQLQALKTAYLCAML